MISDFKIVDAAGQNDCSQIRNLGGDHCRCNGATTVSIENNSVRIDERLALQEGESSYDRLLGFGTAEIRRAIRRPKTRLRDCRRSDIQTRTEPKQRAAVDRLYPSKQTATLIAVDK